MVENQFKYVLLLTYYRIEFPWVNKSSSFRIMIKHLPVLYIIYDAQNISPERQPIVYKTFVIH